MLHVHRVVFSKLTAHKNIRNKKTQISIKIQHCVFKGFIKEYLFNIQKEKKKKKGRRERDRESDKCNIQMRFSLLLFLLFFFH